MLRHSFEPLENSNILWHIVAPLPPSQPDFSLSFLNFAPNLVACLFGWMFDSTRHSLKVFGVRSTQKLVEIYNN